MSKSTSPIDAVISKSHRSERNHVKIGVFIQDIPDTYSQDSKQKKKIIIVIATIIIAAGMSIDVPYVMEKMFMSTGLLTVISESAPNNNFQ